MRNPVGSSSAFAETIHRLLCWFSAGLLTGLTLCYGSQFDAVTAVTVYPAWWWFAIGMAPLLAARRFSNIRGQRTIAILWCVFLLAFVDAPLSLLRGMLPLSGDRGDLRIVTLNCASTQAAAEKILPLQPDVALLQEPPNRDALDKIATALFAERAHVFWSADNVIITRFSGEAIEFPDKRQTNSLRARLEIRSDTFLEAVSVRLLPSPVRMDLWNPQCWRAYASLRRKRRSQLKVVADQVGADRTEMPVVIGGDFNAPPRDAIFELLRPHFRDAFVAAGRGWGRSFMTRLPILRIDQIWATEQLAPIRSFAVSSRHSDHYIVVSDFELIHD